MPQQQQLIASKFEEFRRIAIPADASGIQVQDMQMAFYSGVTALFSIILELLEPGIDAADSDSKVASIHGELQAFSSMIEKMHLAESQKEPPAARGAISGAIKCPYCGHHSIIPGQSSVMAS